MDHVSAATSAQQIVLASASKARTSLLAAAGVQFRVDPARIDERAVDMSVGKPPLDPADLALLLAEAKAVDVSMRHPGALVLGADQTLGFEGQVVHKAADMEEARRRLLDFSGKSHDLNSALVVARDGAVIWEYMSAAHMHMRALTPEFISRYLAACGDEVLSSVSCYQIEGPGIRLFERIDGDYFTVIGLPMLPLLAELRRYGAIE